MSIRPQIVNGWRIWMKAFATRLMLIIIMLIIEYDDHHWWWWWCSGWWICWRWKRWWRRATIPGRWGARQAQAKLQASVPRCPEMIKINDDDDQDHQTDHLGTRSLVSVSSTICLALIWVSYYETITLFISIFSICIVFHVICMPHPDVRQLLSSLSSSISSASSSHRTCAHITFATWRKAMISSM